MGMFITGEVITAAEALARVGLGDLIDGEYDAGRMVEWVGYPKPFACGHTATYGYGPLDRPEDNDRRGKGRRYQSKHRVSQHTCGGAVLFSWQALGGNAERGYYKINSSLVVRVTEIEDSGTHFKDKALGLAWTA